MGHIVIDNEVELNLLDTLTRERKQHIDVLFRVSPGISAHTHELIQTATEDSKFGLPLPQAQAIIQKTLDMEYIHTVGIHCHIGSQIVDEEPFVMAMDINIRTMAAQKNLAMPKLVVEPGRYISATAGITLYTVGTVKDIPGIKKYVCVDGGMADNPRPALYDALYEALLCNKYGEDEGLEKVAISGKACETDKLIDEAWLPSPTPGDTLAVLHTGAYNYAMASNYNRLRRPAVLLLSGNHKERATDPQSLKAHRPHWSHLHAAIALWLGKTRASQSQLF